MPSLEQVQAWIEGYVQAWNSNQPDDIGRLFADDARYYTEPFSPPWRGRQAIVEQWLARKDEPGQARFTWQPLVVSDEVAVIHGQTSYQTPPRTYSNLWVIRLDADGRCTEFTEWWMEHPAA
jgi:uncharacterized protein (TIGR02246 family)